jgi:hypothetical protein
MSQEINGIRPHPQDRIKPIRGGATEDFIHTTEKAVSNDSEFITEWVVKFRPLATVIKTIIAPEQEFGFSGYLIVGYDGDLADESGDVGEEELDLLPVVGRCIQVHGRTVTWKVLRTAPDSNRALPLSAVIAVIPGRVRTFYRSSSKPASAATPALFFLPVYTSRYQIVSQLSAGDTIQVLSAGGVVLQTLTATVNNLFVYLSFHHLGRFIRYNTLDIVPKLVTCGFEVVA